MPRISLRTYEKEIEELIDLNRLQEVIAHCRHILQYFPKNISTYRILGKTFLEEKQYAETADVFARVLTVYPDDFISHVGMSIVRENEKNLDAAIWHMELAFDSQPSNIAIQEELKRLFNLRDGTHPEKIRLTRGALVRMYARGELFQQAIAEIKSALLEDPKRIDLEVLLAKMFYLSGDQTEALELSNRIIIELPYCYEVNKILVEILASSDNPENLNKYIGRLKDLNPYEEFVGTKYISEDQVPDEQVILEKLTEIPTSKTSPDAGWVKDIEEIWQEQGSTVPVERLPGITEFASPQTQIENQIHETETEKQSDNLNASLEGSLMNNSDSVIQNNPNGSEDSNIPDWMRSSGWIPPSGDQPDAAGQQAPSFSDSQPDEAAPADIPDWLKSLAPEQNLTSNEPTPAPDFIKDLENTEEPTLTQPEESQSHNDWMNEMISENSKSEETEESELPDWLKNFEVDEKNEPASKDDLPDWLNSLKENEEKTQSVSDSALLNPLLSLPEEPVNTNPEENPSVFTEGPLGNHVTRVLNNSEIAGLKEGQPESLLHPENVPLPSDWKSTLLQDEGSSESEPDSESSTSNIPAWVNSALDQNPSLQEEISQATPEAESAINIQPPDETDGISESTISKETGDDLLEWLRDLKPADSEADSVLGETPETAEQQSEVETPDFDFTAQLDRLQQINEGQQPPVEEPTTVPETMIPAEMAEKPNLVEESQLTESLHVEPVLVKQEINQDEEEFTTLIEEAAPIASEEPKTEQLEEVSSVVFTEPAVEYKEPLSNLTELANSIESGANLKQSLHELKALSQEKSGDYFVWELLGDAYAKSGDLKNALLSYNKAEEILIKPQ